jgi:hypothetical protein
MPGRAYSWTVWTALSKGSSDTEKSVAYRLPSRNRMWCGSISRIVRYQTVVERSEDLSGGIGGSVEHVVPGHPGVVPEVFARACHRWTTRSWKWRCSQKNASWVGLSLRQCWFWWPGRRGGPGPCRCRDPHTGRPPVRAFAILRGGSRMERRRVRSWGRLKGTRRQLSPREVRWTASASAMKFSVVVRPPVPGPAEARWPRSRR